MLLAFVLALSSASSPIVGTWFVNGAPFATFNANGTCTMADDACSWRATNDKLFVTGPGETDVVPYRVDAHALTITVNGLPIALTKTAGPSPIPVVPSSMPPGDAPPSTPNPSTPIASAPAGSAVNVNDPLAKFLLSSAWCSFHYNQTSGSSSTTRVQYFADGTYSLGSNSEGYSSGAAGTFASQHQGGSSGRWTVKSNVLYVTPPATQDNPMPQQMVPIPMTVKDNGAGNPIVTSNGVEYMRCQ